MTEDSHRPASPLCWCTRASGYGITAGADSIGDLGRRIWKEKWNLSMTNTDFPGRTTKREMPPGNPDSTRPWTREKKGRTKTPRGNTVLVRVSSAVLKRGRFDASENLHSLPGRGSCGSNFFRSYSPVLWCCLWISKRTRAFHVQISSRNKFFFAAAFCPFVVELLRRWKITRTQISTLIVLFLDCFRHDFCMYYSWKSTSERLKICITNERWNRETIDFSCSSSSPTRSW